MSYPEVATLGADVDDDHNTFDKLNALQVPSTDLIKTWPWRVLIAPLSPSKKTKGGIILADETSDAQDYLVATGRLLAIGPQAMTGERLRGKGNMGWVPEVGEWVMFSRYAGWRLYNTKAKLRLVVCNDDDIVGPVTDPRDWRVLV